MILSSVQVLRSGMRSPHPTSIGTPIAVPSVSPSLQRTQDHGAPSAFPEPSAAVNRWDPDRSADAIQALAVQTLNRSDEFWDWRVEVVGRTLECSVQQRVWSADHGWNPRFLEWIGLLRKSHQTALESWVLIESPLSALESERAVRAWTSEGAAPVRIALRSREPSDRWVWRIQAAD